MTLPMRLVVALAALLIASPAMAEVRSMTCKNPFRSYTLSFDPRKRTIFANETQYQIKSVENQRGHLVVAGETGNGGPSFRAEFVPGKEIVFDGNQVDRCR